MSIIRKNKWLRGSATIVGAGVLLLAAYLGFLQVSGNFHTVIAGELYRSAQPTAAQIEDYARRYGIQTIVNLRGASDNASWYFEEVAAAKRLGINHMDFRMRASKQLTAAEADALVAMLKDAPKPILIHCRGGADRTGLASVLYSQRIAGIPTGRAEQQLSLYFGHVGVPLISSAYAMDLTWEMLERHYGLEPAGRGPRQVESSIQS